jgi:hypothetical protein
MSFIHLQIVICSSIFVFSNIAFIAFILVQEQSDVAKENRWILKRMFLRLSLLSLENHICYFCGEKKIWECVTSYNDSVWREGSGQLLVNVIPNITQPLVRRLSHHPGEEIILFSKPSRLALRPTLSHVGWALGICSSGVN